MSFVIKELDEGDGDSLDEVIKYFNSIMDRLIERGILDSYTSDISGVYTGEVSPHITPADIPNDITE